MRSDSGEQVDDRAEERIEDCRSVATVLLELGLGTGFVLVPAVRTEDAPPCTHTLGGCCFPVPVAPAQPTAAQSSR